MNKSRLFKGLTASFGSILSITTFMSVLAFSRTGDINSFFGIKFNDTTSASKYSSVEELDKDEYAHFDQVQEEGSVLLRNENNALPLQSSERKVTLFGNASINTVYHGGSGGPSSYTPVTLDEALTNAGFQVNEKVLNATKAHANKQKNSDIGEVDASIYDENDFKDYNDVAIVVFARFGGEQNDMDVVDSYGVRELSFHDFEKAIMEKVKNGGFKKVIVLLNTGYAMELDWLSDYDVDACLWIGYPGEEGMNAVAGMLKGDCSPSGALVDTYASVSTSSPAMQNFGDFKFSDLPDNMYHCEYLVYQEGIYIGYKYYESRYQDQVLNQHNATSTKGSFASSTGWDYASEITYPFGYGLTYTTFEEKLASLNWDTSKHTLSATVSVKNTGSFACKDVVELYASLPYESGQAQKSAIQLVGFAKSEEIAPGETKEVNIEVSDYIFATYDENATNGKDTSKKGCYVFDSGDYYFAIGSDCHDALNNILSSQNVNSLFDQDGKGVSGDKSLVKKFHLDDYDNVTYAISPYTGEVVSNQFDQVNINYYEKNRVTYLSRDDWNTFPESVTDLKADDDTSGTIRKYMTATSSLYEKPSDAPSIDDISFNQEKTTMFVDMKDVDYDDEKWNQFISQLSPTELSTIFGDGHGHQAVESINFPKGSQGDGPDGLQTNGTLHPSENLAASTWNVELLKDRGTFLSEDAIHRSSFVGVFGGGANLHRTPYGGRNFEYYSEDSTISYFCGMYEAQGMSEGHLISMFKHFVGNDQETNRHGVATFMTEQALRQNETRCFEGALSNAGGSLGNMSSYNRLGVISTACYYNLMTQLLRNEWGFKGISITDSSKDATSYLFTADAINAGTTVFDNDPDRSTEVKSLLIKNKDGNIWKKAQAAAKNFFYAMSRSNLTFSLNENTTVSDVTPWWQTAIWALEISLGTLTILSAGGYVYFTFFHKKKEEK
jgi:beta-glucosidase